VLAALVGGGVAVLSHWMVSADQTGATDMLQLSALCGAGLAAFHGAWWVLVARWRSLGLLTPNVVVVGATSDAANLISGVIDRRDMNILGVFDDRAKRSPLAMLGVPVLGTTDAMFRHRIMPYVDLIVVTIDQSAAARVRQIMGRLAVLPNQVTLLFDDAAENRQAAAIEQISDAPLAPLHATTDAAGKASAKRVQDLVIGAAALLIFAPVMALIALAVRVDSPGPVFFRQRREGFNNEEFLVWKFRTMRHDTADRQAVRQVTADDDRVTRVGRILRKASLDELPQLFNVIVGEMSLVGPRPHAVGMKTGDSESAELVAEYAHRHRIKPGMTGWAAINGSRGPLHEPEEVCRRVALDIAYIERQSIWLDLLIMVKTIPSLLGDRAAVR
jgi:Undecaprenyl-phosphate glucose phosphotransferase